MEYVTLGKSGGKVSRIAFGCLTLGREAGQEESIRMVNRCLARKRGQHPIALAIAWVASHPAVTCPIIGARNEEQLKETLKLAELRISFQERDQINEEGWG
jgi:aryl-alcohol dehydrogenase-like predicted oxidoreductase